jgi:hypothetical protein
LNLKRLLRRRFLLLYLLLKYIGLRKLFS